MIGAATSIVSSMNTSSWTCCTSLVVRVISVGAPSSVISRCGERLDLAEDAGAHVAADAPSTYGRRSRPR